jgi:hypothetical protein
MDAEIQRPWKAICGAGLSLNQAFAELPSYYLMLRTEKASTGGKGLPHYLLSRFFVSFVHFVVVSS